MTVSSGLVLEVSYDGDGVADEFAYAFPTTSDSHVKVWHYDDAGAETLWTQGVEYTLTRGSTSGTVTSASPLPADETIKIAARYAYEQSTSFASQARFLPSIHDSALDYLALLLKQVLHLLFKSWTFPTHPAGRSTLSNVDITLAEGDSLTYEGDDVVPMLEQLRSGQLIPYSESATGSLMTFSSPLVYGLPSSPVTAAGITHDLSGARIGVVQKMYHLRASAPTVPAGWVLLGGTYVPSALNIIYCEWVAGSRVEYWIVQEA